MNKIGFDEPYFHGKIKIGIVCAYYDLAIEMSKW